MKIKFGAIVVGGSGKVGGHVISHNRGGQYIRTKVKPTNPRTASQIAVRARFSTNSKGWSALTEAQRVAWNTASPVFKAINAMGDVMILSGKALYQRIAQNLGTISSAIISSPVNPGAGFNLTTFSATAVNATGVVTLTYTAAIPATHKLVVQATGSLNSGTYFVKNRLRQFAVYQTADASPITATAAYTAKFGAVGAVGKKIYFKAYAIEIASGVPSQGVMCTAIIS